MSGPSDVPKRAALVLGCRDLDRAIESCEAVGFRLDAIGPADEPTWAELSQAGLALVLDSSIDQSARPQLRLSNADLDTPPDLDGVDIEAVAWEPPIDHGRPVRPALVVTDEDDGHWKGGRAGMRYRDLIPDRWGGAFVVSHIHVPTGGPVPDYVHHHDVVGQLIFCHRGWVKVVYQDQGPPLTMYPGDLILQPPGIRHRVLESSEDLYVVELSSPATHRTSVDHDLTLPTRSLEPTRRYQGQRFIHHVAGDGDWQAAPEIGFEQQPTALADASGGLLDARLLRAASPDASLGLGHQHELRLIFVTDGSGRVVDEKASRVMRAGGSAAVPPNVNAHLDSVSAQTVILEVTAGLS